eukprot:m.90324 g.90324  ORF g.90324 m.90324 type:complete len:88 (+) comp51094_c0_seq9:189-452(+)
MPNVHTPAPLLVTGSNAHMESNSRYPSQCLSHSCKRNSFPDPWRWSLIKKNSPFFRLVSIGSSFIAHVSFFTQLLMYQDQDGKRRGG